MNTTQNSSITIKGHVTRISRDPKKAPKGNYLFRGVEILVEPANHRGFVLFPEHAGMEIYEFPLLCLDQSFLSLRKVTINNVLDDNSVIYLATSETIPILEPYRTVSVIEAADAAICIRSADIRNRVSLDEPFFVAKGKLIHQLFDSILREYPELPENFFYQAFKRAVPLVTCIMPGSDISADLETLRDEAEIHFLNILKWLAGNKIENGAGQTEIDILSTEWGLKGRADALIDTDLNGRFILELKTGRFSSREHLLQLLAYQLMFAPDNQPIQGEILYTINGKTEKIKSTELNALRSLLVSGRNRAVFLKMSFYREGIEIPFDGCPKQGNCFSRNGCRILYPMIDTEQSWTQHQRAYYDKWFTVIAKECKLLDDEMANILNPDTLQDRVEQGITIVIDDIEIQGNVDNPSLSMCETRNVRMSPKERLRLRINPAAMDFSLGEEIILHASTAADADAVRCTIIDSDSDSLLIAPKSRFNFDKSKTWFFERIPFSRGKEIAKYALYNFVFKAQTNVREFVIATESFEFEPSEIETHKEIKIKKKGKRKGNQKVGELNEQQIAAVARAVETKNIHLLHGPPGTGKTRVLTSIILQCLARGERLLIACPTNVALDRVLISLLNNNCRDFLRIGGVRNASPEFIAALSEDELEKHFFDALAERSTDFKEFKKQFATAPLIGATAYQCAAHPAFRKQLFDRVIIDEAGQLDEPMTLAPMTFGKCCVLAGDHLQLPPVTRNRQTGENNGAGISLFERLYRTIGSEHISKLIVQYRMNQEIQDIPSDLFYDGQLKPAFHVANRRLQIQKTVETKLGNITDPEHPAIFVDVPGEDAGKGRLEEAEAAARIINQFVRLGIPVNEIGVITPYRVQQYLIQQNLKQTGENYRDISVDTVDRFQGGEREIILLSLARSDSVTSFLSDRKRLNVSLSRARSKLIVLGHKQLLLSNDLFSSLISKLHEVTFALD